jgi:hypothetical protein
MTDFKHILDTIVSDPQLHAKWLNTLSMMENTGARKISASEHKSKVTLVVLKHAAEEARHAYYLKKQIAKIDADLCPDYSREWLISPWHSMAYLNALDVDICRYLKNELGLKGFDLKFGAYLLVTYAIEVRADELYPVYQEVLSAHQSKVNVKSIIAEEETHLAEMLHQMKTFFSDWEKHAEKASSIESALFNNWVKELSEELCAVV